MANNYGAVGTLSMEDIYGNGSLDTLLPSTASASDKTNPNDGDMTGAVSSGKSSVLNLKGKKIFNQPIVVWIGLIGLLALLKYGVEGKASKALKGIGV